MDGIIQAMTKQLDNVALAYLCTPTDTHLIPASAKAATRTNRARAPLWQQIFSMIPGGNKSNKIETVDSLHATDAVVLDQGPNYIMAKRLQHWRAIVARGDDGCVVSSNIAPSTATASVLSNKAFALAYKGMHLFKPMEVFYQETSNSVMAALLIYDINSRDSAAHPQTKLANPLSLFAANGFHGGMWRCGYKFTTIGKPAALAAVFGMLVNAYLVAYNCAQACGWAQIFLLVCSAYTSTSSDSMWLSCGPAISFWQNLAMMEVVHSLVGAVRAPWHSTLLQIASRVFVVALINWLSVLHSNSALFIIGFAWSITEVIRYSWYALSGMGIKIKPFTLLRYSTFLPLYPIGVYGELALVYGSTAAITGAAGAAAMVQPNQPEFVEYFLIPFVQFFGISLETVFTRVVPALYAFGLPFLYSLMWASRNNVIKKFAAASAAKKDKKD